MCCVVNPKENEKWGARDSKVICVRIRVVEELVLILLALWSPATSVATAAGPDVERAAAVFEVEAEPAHKPQATFGENDKEEAVDPPLRSLKESLQHTTKEGRCERAIHNQFQLDL